MGRMSPTTSRPVATAAHLTRMIDARRCERVVARLTATAPRALRRWA